METVAVVLAGGVGTRLYPASSPARPKQFLEFDGRSLLAATVERARAVADRTYVLTRSAYVERAREHLADESDGGALPDVDVLVEPAGKDTGPALTYASWQVRERHPDATMLALPSDHHVGEEFAAVARQAVDVARETDRLVTLGVEPTRPATEYGYLKPGDDHGEWREVEAFREKPDPGAAARYREHGYLWNAGAFAWRPDAFLAAARDSPLSSLVEALERGTPEAGFAGVESVSVDYAVLERADDVAVVPADVTWDDLGSWDALARIYEADDDGNVVRGSALTVDAEDCVVATDEDSHVSLVGVSGLAVAAYDGRVLVAPTRDAQRVREVVAHLREAGRYPEVGAEGDATVDGDGR